MPFLDTNIIIRFLTGDDPVKQEACSILFTQIEQGEKHVFVPDVVIAEVVYVLASPRLYNHSRQTVADLLTPLLHLPHLEVQNHHIIVQALHIYAQTPKLDFADAYIVAAMEHAQSTQLISYDTDFDSFPSIRREEPPGVTTEEEHAA